MTRNLSDVVILLLCSYTWKIYAKKVLTMGGMYGFWRELNLDQKAAKDRYNQMIYNLQFRELVRK